MMTDPVIRSLTLLNLTFFMVCSVFAFLLLLKERADKAVETLAATDSLTGLLNRRHFLATAQRIFERRRTESNPLVVLYLDIDHFKKVNETYGRHFGDELLAGLAAVIRSMLRAQDLSCRYGGEEFLILLSDVNAGQVVQVSTRIMAGIRQLAFDGHPEFSCTVSIGVAEAVPGPQETLAGFIDKADKALYLAKKSGRNRVVAYPGASNRAPAISTGDR
jgi:diguanylate cyclase (GGDEF)-like protein